MDVMQNGLCHRPGKSVLPLPMALQGPWKFPGPEDAPYYNSGTVMVNFGAHRRRWHTAPPSTNMFHPHLLHQNLLSCVYSLSE